MSRKKIRLKKDEQKIIEEMAHLIYAMANATIATTQVNHGAVAYALVSIAIQIADDYDSLPTAALMLREVAAEAEGGLIGEPAGNA